MSRKKEARGLPISRRAYWVAFVACGSGSVAAALLVLHGASGGGAAPEVPSRAAGEIATLATSEAVAGALREEMTASISREEVSRQLGEMPFVFARNDGQWPAEVKYGARGHGLSAAFTKRGRTLSAPLPSDEGSCSVRAVSFEFFGDEVESKAPEGERKLRGVHNYLLGNEPSKWHTDVPLFEAVRYDSVAPGVALLVSDRDGMLAYDLHVEPGARLDQVEIGCGGIDSIEIEPDGTLVLSTPDGAVRQTPPRSWYELPGGEQKPAEVRFRKIGASTSVSRSTTTTRRLG